MDRTTIKHSKDEARSRSAACTLAQLMVIYFLLQLLAIAATRRFDPDAVQSLSAWDGMTPITRPDLFDGGPVDPARHICAGQFTIQGMPN